MLREAPPAVGKYSSLPQTWFEFESRFLIPDWECSHRLNVGDEFLFMPLHKALLSPWMEAGISGYLCKFFIQTRLFMTAEDGSNVVKFASYISADMRKYSREHSRMAPSLLETFSPPPPPLSYCVIIWHTSGWCLFDDIILGQALRICSYPVCCGFLSAKQTCKPYCLHCSKKVRVKYKNIFYIWYIYSECAVCNSQDTSL